MLRYIDDFTSAHRHCNYLCYRRHLWVLLYPLWAASISRRQSANFVHTWHRHFSWVRVLINHWKLHIVMNKNDLQVLENIYAARRLILMTGADIIKTFSDGEMWKPLKYNHWLYLQIYSVVINFSESQLADAAGRMLSCLSVSLCPGRQVGHGSRKEGPRGHGERGGGGIWGGETEMKRKHSRQKVPVHTTRGRVHGNDA